MNTVQLNQHLSRTVSTTEHYNPDEGIYSRTVVSDCMSFSWVYLSTRAPCSSPPSAFLVTLFAFLIRKILIFYFVSIFRAARSLQC